MKLIDILVEELPKSGGWLRDVKTMTQDRIGNIWGYDCYSPRLKGGLWSSKSGDDLVRDSKVEARNLAVDWNTAIITREQYEAALAAKNEGWIEWGGGECQVEKGVRVDVKYRDGNIYQNKPALGDRNIRWSHVGSRNDIIAYRLHHPKEVEQYKEGGEADLNECASQTPAPVWSGEGLPPVGCEFEYGSHRTKAKCLAVAHHMVFASKGNPDDEESDYEEFMISILDSEFHRVRTEAERKREEAVKAITLTGWCQDFAEEIYDLIAAGKVPCVKLED